MKFPIEKNKVLVTGFPYIDKNSQINPNIPKKEEIILFLSQLRSDIADIAYELSIICSNDILFKAHPREYSLVDSKYGFLKSRSNITMIQDDKVDLYQYFRQSKFVIGIYSTALLEAIAFKCIIIILKLPGGENMKDLIEDRSTIYFANNVNEALNIIKSHNDISNDYIENDINYYFRSDFYQ